MLEVVWMEDHASAHPHERQAYQSLTTKPRFLFFSAVKA
ncbi:hypothetical protein CUJ84_Chr000802 [Rhizobium leguminosarum]|uniref:Uncharacterized protein n=1 Tax=Rhizobium leguminosarum TaxID=384 RepID=A0A2K9YYZ4_RHILE|nr:hypothetical protein CUJ84_Chr000802 [Rhizobium leguminosarum]